MEMFPLTSIRTMRIPPSFTLLTLSQAASHCSGFMIHCQTLLNKIKKTPQKLTQKITKKRTALLFRQHHWYKVCSVLTGLFRKLQPDFKSSPAVEIYKKILSQLSSYCVLPPPDSSGLENTVIGKKKSGKKWEDEEVHLLFLKSVETSPLISAPGKQDSCIQIEKKNSSRFHIE